MQFTERLTTRHRRNTEREEREGPYINTARNVRKVISGTKQRVRSPEAFQAVKLRVKNPPAIFNINPNSNIDPLLYDNHQLINMS